jgi:hypothetical protein
VSRFLEQKVNADTQVAESCRVFQLTDSQKGEMLRPRSPHPVQEPQHEPRMRQSVAARDPNGYFPLWFDNSYEKPACACFRI